MEFKNMLTLILTIFVFARVTKAAVPTYDFCKTRLRLDSCVGSIPTEFTTDNDSEMKKISCCFNSLILDERKLYFCMKRERKRVCGGYCTGTKF